MQNCLGRSKQMKKLIMASGIGVVVVRTFLIMILIYALIILLPVHTKTSKDAIFFAVQNNQYHLKECIEKNYSTIRYKDVVKGCEFLGRCLVAAKDFDSRDILFTEQAFATAIHKDKRSTACFNCTQLCNKCIYEKCSYCNSVFCSSECFSEGKKCHSVLFSLFSYL